MLWRSRWGACERRRSDYLISALGPSDHSNRHLAPPIHHLPVPSLLQRVRHQHPYILIQLHVSGIVRKLAGAGRHGPSLDRCAVTQVTQTDGSSTPPRRPVFSGFGRPQQPALGILPHWTSSCRKSYRAKSGYVRSIKMIY